MNICKAENNIDPITTKIKNAIKYAFVFYLANFYSINKSFFTCRFFTINYII